jgi:transposase InsO family protein
VGILPRAPGGFRFLFVRVDTFTKWIEVTPVVNITQEAAVKFLQSIIYRFGVPKRVLTDNGTQFKGAKFSKCCTDFSIDHQPSSAAHPQTNGQVERTNGLLLQGMKIRMFWDLEARGRNWHKELPSVLWALRTNVNRATREPMLTEQPEIRPSIWFTEQKQYCHQKFISSQPEWHSLMKKIRTNQGNWTQIC